MFFRGNTLTVTNTFTLPDDARNCSQEIKLFSNLTGNLPQRLISCPDSKSWATGITNPETKRKYSLEHVSLNCSRRSIISGYNYQIEWQASLQISVLTTDPGSPFDKVIFIIICSCVDCSGFNYRHDEAYLVQSKFQIRNQIKQLAIASLINICCQLLLTIIVIIHQTHYEKSDRSRAFNQFTIACELDMINAISAADIAFIMSSSTSAWLLSPLECSPQKQNG